MPTLQGSPAGARASGAGDVRREIELSYPGGVAALILTRHAPGRLPLISLEGLPDDRSEPMVNALQRAAWSYSSCRDLSVREPAAALAEARRLATTEPAFRAVFGPALELLGEGQ